MAANGEIVLTNTDTILYLLELGRGEEKMIGYIRPKDRCAVGQCRFVEIKKLGYLCPAHKTTPKRFFIDLFYKGKRVKLYSDKQGRVLDSYGLTLNLLSHINYEIKNHSFDPSKYIKQELEAYYVSNLLDRFLASKIDTLAPSYKSDYKRCVSVAKNFFGVKDARELRKLDIVNYKDHIGKNFGLSGKTVKNILDNFKTFLRYLKNDLELLGGIPSFPPVEVQEPKTIWLSPEVQRRVFENVPDEDKPIMAFLMLSGCRPGEARALRCRDVNLELKTITISATFSGGMYREKRKGKKSKNTIIPIHPELFDHIENRVNGNLPEAYLFINPRTQKYYSKCSLEKLWVLIRKKVGLNNDVRLYDATRHSFASQLINSGVSLLSVSRLLGHSSTKMTERYAHSDLEKLKIDVANLSLMKDKTVPKLSLEVKRKI